MSPTTATVSSSCVPGRARHQRLAATCLRPRRSGFSLVEALIALALSSVILVLVTSVFVAQNRFYQDVVHRSELQESVRSVAELVAADVRALTEGSIVVAEGSRIVFRTPVFMGTTCGSGQEPNRHVYFPLDGAPVSEGGEKSGLAVRWTDGSWLYFYHDWSELYAGSGELATVSSCAGLGADTSGAKSDFVRLTVPFDQGGNWMFPGLPLQLFAEIEIHFATSVLQPERRALFRGVSGSSLTEFATGLSPTSRFEYRVDGAYAASATGGELSRIDAVRVVIEASAPGPDGSSTVHGWTVDVPLRNVAAASGGGDW